MKRNLLIFCFSVLMCQKAFSNQVIVEQRAAYYLPVDSNTRNTFSGNGIYGVDINVQLWKYVFGCVGASIYYDYGKSSDKSATANLYYVPIDFAIKAVYNYEGTYRPYLGAGITAGFIAVDTSDPYLIRSNTTWDAGGIFKVGTLFNPTGPLQIDIFINCHVQPYHFSRKGDLNVFLNSGNITGFSFGGGIGYQF